MLCEVFSMNVPEHILKVLVTTLRSLLFVTLLVLTNQEDTVTNKISNEIRFGMVEFDMMRYIVLSCHCLQIFQGVHSFLNTHTENVCKRVVPHVLCTYSRYPDQTLHTREERKGRSNLGIFM